MGSGMIAILTRRFLQCGSAIQNRTLLTNATTSTRTFRLFSLINQSIKNTFRSFSTFESIKSLQNEGRFLLTKLQSTLRKEFRRNGSDKRPAKKWKEIKFSDLKQIFPLIYPWKISRRILGKFLLITDHQHHFLRRHCFAVPLIKHFPLFAKNTRQIDRQHGRNKNTK